MRSIIDKGLATAWKELGDLKTEITVVKKSNAGFDFGSATVDENAPVNLIVEAVVFESKKKDGIETKEIFFRHKDIGRMNQYSKVIISGDEWSIGPNIVNDDGFTKFLYVTRRGR